MNFSKYWAIKMVEKKDFSLSVSIEMEEVVWVLLLGAYALKLIHLCYRLFVFFTAQIFNKQHQMAKHFYNNNMKKFGSLLVSNMWIGKNWKRFCKNASKATTLYYRVFE